MKEHFWECCIFPMTSDVRLSTWAGGLVGYNFLKKDEKLHFHALVMTIDLSHSFPINCMKDPRQKKCFSSTS